MSDESKISGGSGRYSSVERQVGIVSATLEAQAKVQEKQAQAISQLYDDVDHIRRGSKDGSVHGQNQIRERVKKIEDQLAAEEEEKKKQRTWLTRTIIAWLITTVGSIVVGVLIATSGG